MELYLTFWRTCYSCVSVKFPGKDLVGQYIPDFRDTEIYERTKIQQL